MKIKNENLDMAKMFAGIKEQVTLHSSVDSKAYIPDIIEFCESSKYLNLTSSGITLYPMQKIILKCVSGNNHVIDADSHERLTVKEFCDTKRKRILALDKHNKIVSGNVVWSGETGKKEVFQVKLSGTKRSIYVTEDHLVLTSRGYKAAIDLDVSDLVVIPRKLPLPLPLPLLKCNIPDHEIKLLAYFVGDGACSHYPHFVSNDKEHCIRRDFIDSVKSFDSTLRCDFRQQSGRCIIKVVKNCKNERDPHVNNSMWNFLNKHGLARHTAHNKRIPLVIYSLEEKQLYLFLNRLFCTDGYATVLNNKSKKSHSVIGYTTCNILLAEDVQHLLLRCGIIADITTFQVPYVYKNQKTMKTQHQVIIRRSRDILIFAENIGILNKEEKINEIVNFSSKVRSYSHFDILPDKVSNNLRNEFKNLRKRKLSYSLQDQLKFDRLYKKNTNYNRRYAQYVHDLTGSSYAETIIKSDIAYDKVDSIVSLGKEQVYDISVSKYHNFLCNDIVVHNCFYRGQAGNECLSLTDEELELLRSEQLHNVMDKYNSEDLFRELVLVLGRRCVSEDTTIVDPATGREWSLGEMWDYGKTEGIMSWTYDERTSDMKIIPNCTLVHQGVRPVYELTTVSGHRIEATNNHPFMTKRGWVQLKDLDINNDQIALVESQPFFGTSDAISEDEAAVLGYMTGDGCCSQSGMFFTCANEEVLKDFKNRINNISNNLTVFSDPWTGAKSKEYQYKIKSKERIQETYYNEKACKVMSKFIKSDLQKLLIKHGLAGKTCHHKVAPKVLFECPKKVIAAYLRALYSCDGGIYVRNNSNVSMEFYTVNKIQAYSVQKLLARFGIFSTVKPKRAWTRIKRENKSYHSLSYRVSFYKAKYVYTFLDEIGFVGKSPEVIAKALNLSKQNYKESFSPYILRSIEKIRFLSNKRTFDLQVSDNPSEQNFECNGFMVHNSGKDFLVSIMALYETMKLLEVPGGCPYKYYTIAPGNPIYILTVATSSDQARILFLEIKSKLQNSMYFQDKIGNTEADRLWMLTPEDKKRNKIATEKGIPGATTKGSVVIMSGHSNSDSLLGKGYFCLLFDEVASFKTTGSSTSGERLYAALGPGTVAFNKKIYEEDGKHTVSPKDKTKATLLLDDKGFAQRRLDSKIISISSPRAEEGIFYNLYKFANEEPSRLTFKLPTWRVNLGITEDLLRKENKYMSPNAFLMEFGAEFSGTAGEKFVPDQLVDDASSLGEEMGIINPSLQGRRGMIYYAHLDPAATSHNYALIVLHVEERIQVKEHENGSRSKEKVKMFIVDHIKVWYPGPKDAINVLDVDNYIMDLARRFRFAMVSYDSWNSRASIMRLRSKGVPSKETPFRKQYKVSIYNQLEHLLVNHQLALPYRGPHADEMKMELKCLKRIYTPTGFKIQPDPEAAITTDDCCDGLAGAIGVATETTYGGYAKGTTAYVPQSQQMGHGDWNIGSGSYDPQLWKSLNRRFGKFG